MNCNDSITSSIAYGKHTTVKANEMAIALFLHSLEQLWDGEDLAGQSNYDRWASQKLYTARSFLLLCGFRWLKGWGRAWEGTWGMWEDPS